MKRQFLFVLTTVLALGASADEGMWMPQQVPQLPEQVRSGITLDPQRLADLTGDPMGAIVSLGGCSASFVSPKGLVVTNHHCVYSYLQYNSSTQADYIRDGFLAKTLAEERQASPDARVFVTQKIEDVTSTILGNLPSNIGDVERNKRIERRRKEMTADCEKAGGVRCQVASFFGGSQYLRITQMEIRDVRLVYAPAAGVGNYGGEVDNWMWPRHTGDFSFLRAYVGPDGKAADYSPANVPYQPKHWLKVSTADLDAGEPVMVIGYPGVTYRYQLASEVAETEEFTYPTSIRYRRALMDILEERGRSDRAVAIANASRIRSLANYLKKHEGTLDAFRKGGLREQRLEEERRLAAMYASDPKAAKQHEALMSELAAVNAKTSATRERDTVMSWLYTSSPMLSQANTIYRLTRERAKKDMDRRSGYQERDWPRLKAGLARAQRTIEPGSDRAGLRYFLIEASKLPLNQRIVALDRLLGATGQQTVEQQVDRYLDELYRDTKVGDLAEREKVFAESTEQLLSRNDPMINLAAALRTVADANEKRDEESEGALARLRPQYVEALRKLRGGILAPDANSTLRVSFARIAGYIPRDGVVYQPFTSLGGILEKESGEEPFNSPKALLESAAAKKFGTYVDPELEEVPVNYVSTGDITNGSSGSATLNGRGELIGLAFDGNYEAMGSDFVVDPDVTRSIHVDSRYMLWVMDAVDGAHNLMLEMGVTPQFAK